MLNTKMFPIFFLCLASCSYPKVTARQNFDSMLQGMVGSDLRQSETLPFRLGYKGDLTSTRTLSNGIIENFYKWKSPQGDCKYVLEVNSKTNHVMSARVDGDVQSCRITP